jgi:hypothetical protein
MAAFRACARGESLFYSPFKFNGIREIGWWRRRESNRTSVLKTLNLLILRKPELA